MPTHGLVPHSGVFGLEPTIDYVGPMARTVEDVAVTLQSLAGRDGLDPRQGDVPATLPTYTDSLGRGVNGLRIGILEEGFGVKGGDPAVDDAVMEAVSALERAGARVERVSVPLHLKALPALLPIYLEGGKRMYDTHFGGAFAKTYYPSSLISIFGRLKQSHAREFSPNLNWNLLRGLLSAAQLRRPALCEGPERATDLRGPVRSRLPLGGPARDADDSPDRAALAGAARLRGRARADHAGRPAKTSIWGRSSPTRAPSTIRATRRSACRVPSWPACRWASCWSPAHFREDTLLQVAAAYQGSVDWTALLATPGPQTA